MEQIFKGTIPGVAFSQFEYKGDVEGFISFLKELENNLNEIPDIFGINPQDKLSINTRVEQQNKLLIELIKNNPGIKEQINEFKNNHQ